MYGPGTGAWKQCRLLPLAPPPAGRASFANLPWKIDRMRQHHPTRHACTLAWMLSLAAAASTASAAAPAYTLVQVERGALRTGCPALNDAGRLAFAFRDLASDTQPADGVAFWSQARGSFALARFAPGDVLGSLVGLSNSGAAVASLTASPSPDFTGAVLIRPNGEMLTRPPGFTGAMRVTPLAVTPRGAILANGVVDGTVGAFVLSTKGRLKHQPVPYLAEVHAINDAGAAIGGAWVDSGDRYASFWRSPQGAVQRLPGLPGTGDHDQTRARALNGVGAVVGVTILQSGQMRATLWDTPSSVPRELSPPPGGEALSCRAHAVNDRGEVVGTCNANGGAGLRAFHWSSATGMRPLASLLPPEAVAAGAEVLENGCLSINNQGSMAFSLVDDGSAAGVPALLQPAR